MDLDNVDPELILARGRYATINSAYKNEMAQVQSWTQQACDYLRHALQASTVEATQGNLQAASHLCAVLLHSSEKCAELKAQKDELFRAAWGK
jgi:hypothetical protein